MNRMKDLRERMGISMKEAARRLSIPYTTYVNYEKCVREPNSETLIQIANFYNTSIDFLLGNSSMVEKTVCVDQNRSTEKQLPPGLMPMPKFVKKPRLGTIACGKPILAVEEAEVFDDVPEGVNCDFTLKCKGDSMINARVFDGDIVYIRQQEMVDNGDIAAVLIEDETTLKRVRLFEDHIVLEPENPMYKPLVYWGEEMNTIRILGKAVAFTSAMR